MPNFSAAKTDLYTPWKRGHFFADGEARHTASLCAELSRLAYLRQAAGYSFDSAQVQSILATIAFTNCQFIESAGAAVHGGTHCFLALGRTPAPAADVAVVVFRGTDSDDPTDLGADADFILKPWAPGGKVHTGFANALDSIRPALDAALSALHRPVLFTGHSLGAALATLAASHYRATLPGVSLYTYGSPMVGDAAFVATLAGVPSFRYRHCCDVVTRIPPGALGYAHVGPPLYINRNGGIALNPPQTSITEDRAAAEADYVLHYAWKTGNVGVRDMADHSPINYVWPITAAG